VEILDAVIKKYQNNLITTAQIIEELIQLAKDIRYSDKRGEQFNLRPASPKIAIVEGRSR
jgi:type I restriction enzyme R subunit